MNQFIFGFNAGLTFLEGSFVVDSGQTSGIRSLKGSGIKAVSKVATGVYKVQLEDTYARYLAGFSGAVEAGSSVVAMGSLSIGSIYIIASLGNSTQTQWEAAGVPAGVPAAVGLAFTAKAIGAGTGAVVIPAPSGISTVEVIGDPNLSVTALADPHFLMVTLGATASGDTTMIAKAPVDGSVIGIAMLLRNSSVKGKGE